MNILITSSRNPFALDMVRKLAVCGHTVVASDTYDAAIGSHSKYLAGHAVTASPRFDTDAFISDISAILTRHQIELIVPTFEEAFYLAARRGDLPEGVTVYTGQFGDLARLHDKVSFQRLAHQAGVPVPETVVATDDESLHAAAAKFPQYFARAAFSRGGVALLTNTGPLAGHVSIDDCHPSAEQPWLVQPFVTGPMVCSYSTAHQGRITSHCTYRAPEQWDHSTGIAFLAVESADTLKYAQDFAAALNYTGQLSFDYVEHEDGLMAIECNPRTTDGVMLMTPEQLTDGLTRADSGPAVVPVGVEDELKFAVLADCFTEPLKHLPVSVHDLLHVRSVEKGWRDEAPMLWSPGTLIHGAKLARGQHRPALAALADDIVWNGESIEGISAQDAATLEAVHAQRV